MHKYRGSRPTCHIFSEFLGVSHAQLLHYFSLSQPSAIFLRSAAVLEKIASLIRPVTTYVIWLRVLRKFIPPRAQYVVLLGHAWHTEHRPLHISETNWIRDRSAKQVLLLYFREKKHTSPDTFSAHVIFLRRVAVDSAPRIVWETDFYPVPVLGRIALSLWGFQTAAQYWIKIVSPWVQKFYPVLGLESAGRLLRHFQTPVLYWINFIFCRSTFWRGGGPTQANQNQQMADSRAKRKKGTFLKLEKANRETQQRGSRRGKCEAPCVGIPKSNLLEASTTASTKLLQCDFPVHCWIRGCLDRRLDEIRGGASKFGVSFRGVSSTPDPYPSAKESRYQWELHREINWSCTKLFPAKGGHTFARVSR